MSAPAFVPIGTIAQFSVLGRDGVTGSAGAGTVVTGDVGSSPTPTIVNFPPSTVAGGFTLHLANDAEVIQARIDGQAAYAYLLGLAVDATIPAQLDGQTLTSGVYDFVGGAAADLAALGTLTLNGPGLFIFKVGTALTANVGSVVVGTADPCNVYWQIGTSATLNGDNFWGSKFADASITVSSDCILSGRSIAGLGAAGSVTMPGAGGNTIGGCAVAPPITYQIEVTYTPETTGCHTICYGQTSPVVDTPCCIIDNTVSTPGTPKTFLITVGVTACDTGGPASPVGEAPDTYTYEGTVTPCCGEFPVAWGPVDFVVVAP